MEPHLSFWDWGTEGQSWSQADPSRCGEWGVCSYPTVILRWAAWLMVPGLPTELLTELSWVHKRKTQK